MRRMKPRRSRSTHRRVDRSRARRCGERICGATGSARERSEPARRPPLSRKASGSPGTFGDEHVWTDTLHMNEVLEKNVDRTDGPATPPLDNSVMPGGSVAEVHRAKTDFRESAIARIYVRGIRCTDDRSEGHRPTRLVRTQTDAEGRRSSTRPDATLLRLLSQPA